MRIAAANAWAATSSAAADRAVRRLSTTQKLTLSAMAAALTVLALFAYGALPAGRYACLFAASLFVYIIAYEKAYIWAVVSFFASSAIGFLLIPDKLSMAPFVALLGHFGIMKAFVDDRIYDKMLRMAVILLYCNIFTAAGIAISVFVLDIDVAALLPDIAVWIMIVMAEAGFILFTILYSFCQRIYVERFRRFIITTKR